MVVKVGQYNVSEAAYAYAKGREDEKSENALDSLSKQFKDVNFSVGTKMFSGSGTNNISIAPSVLRQMENDPQKRLEYEALIYDCSNVLNDSSNRPPGLKAQGIVIGNNGDLSMWMISQSSNEQPKLSILRFNDDDKKNLANSLKKKNKTNVTVAKTDKVDAEIRLLKNKKLKLEQQISTSANQNADLQKQLAQIENELRQKDNDTYRKAHAHFSNGIDIMA